MRANRMHAGSATRIAGALALVLATTAGAGAAFAQQPPEMPGPMPNEAAPEATDPAAQSCPEVIRGVEVKTQPVDSGVAVEFKSPRTEYVAELRLALREIAAALEHQSKVASVHAERQGVDNEADLPPVDIAVREVKAGAQLTVRAEKQGDVTALRELARAFETAWADSECVNGPATATRTARTPPPGPRALRP